MTGVQTCALPISGVALKHGRNAVLCELNPDYAALIPDRVRSIAGAQRDMLREIA